MNTVKLRPDAVDYGNTSEVFVSGYSSISRISAGIIRETFFTEREQPDGMIERIIVLHVMWDADAWFAARRMTATADLQHIPPQPQQNALGHNGEQVIH